MKLLILTQKVDKNDDILGFFHRWIEEFSYTVEKVVVICLVEGEHSLPDNVNVYSLGKEHGASRFTRTLRFFRLITKLRSSYDTVFVHMNPEYVVLGGLFWRIWNKRVVLWYTHRAVNLRLRVAEVFAHVLLTASSHSFNLVSKKVVVVGHGIDVKQFFCSPYDPNKVLRFLSVGRITPIKRCEVLIEAAQILKLKMADAFEVAFVGNPAGSADASYKKKLEALIAQHHLEEIVHFIGSVPNHKMPKLYCESDATVNMAPTGGVDKVILESMASARPCFATNNSFRTYFGEYSDKLLYEEGNAEELANKIEQVFRDKKYATQVGLYLKNSVQKTADINILIPRIMKNLS